MNRVILYILEIYVQLLFFLLLHFIIFYMYALSKFCKYIRRIDK